MNKKNKTKKKFQDSNIFIQLYRRLIYQIPYFLKAVWVWFISPMGNKRLLFSLTYIEWQMKANYLYTFEEVKEKLNNIIKQKRRK